MFHLRFKQRFTFFDVQLLRFALLFPLISQVLLLSACPSSLSQNLWKDAKIKASAESHRDAPLSIKSQLLHPATKGRSVVSNTVNQKFDANDRNPAQAGSFFATYGHIAPRRFVRCRGLGIRVSRAA